MLVATFGPATGWQGREIIWDLDHFILVGHGSITPDAVLDYDRQGFLLWASPELRPWVVSVSQWAAAPRGYGAAAPAGAAQPGSQPRARGKLPTWALILIILCVLAVVGGMILAIVIPMFVIRTGETMANDAAVRSGTRNIQVGVESWAAEHAGVYPEADAVTAVGLSRYVTAWPQNPYAEMPMSPGTGPGYYTYEVSPGGGTYILRAYGRDGTVILTLSGGDGGTVWIPSDPPPGA